MEGCRLDILPVQAGICLLYVGKRNSLNRRILKQVQDDAIC